MSMPYRLEVSCFTIVTRCVSLRFVGTLEIRDGSFRKCSPRISSSSIWLWLKTMDPKFAWPKQTQAANTVVRSLWPCSLAHPCDPRLQPRLLTFHQQALLAHVSLVTWRRSNLCDHFNHFWCTGPPFEVKDLGSTLTPPPQLCLFVVVTRIKSWISNASDQCPQPSQLGKGKLSTEKSPEKRKVSPCRQSAQRTPAQALRYHSSMRRKCAAASSGEPLLPCKNLDGLVQDHCVRDKGVKGWTINSWDNFN